MDSTERSTLSAIRFRLSNAQANALARQNIHTVFIIPALKRSGHHAIIDWVLNQLDGYSIYYNFANKRSGGNIIDCCDSWWASHEQIPDSSILRAAAINFENLTELSPRTMEQVEHECRAAFPNARCYRKLFVLRDAYNHFASCETRRPGSWLPKTWTDYAHHFLQQFDSEEQLLVLFNTWFADSRERFRLCIEFQCDRFVPCQERVSHFGKGSSFDQLTYDGDASSMKVLDRWKNIGHNLLKRMEHTMNPHIHELNGIIFGEHLVAEVLARVRQT
jgi:hypothetical protein